MSRENWEDLYMLAAKEVNGNRMPERVAAVRTAVSERMRDLDGSSNHHDERVRLASTVEQLGTLESEAKNW